MATVYRPVTAEEKKRIVAAYQNGASLRELMRVFKRADGTVRDILLQAGITLQKQSFDGLLSSSAIFRKLHISPSCLFRLLSALNIQPVAKSNNNGYYFTPEQFDQIEKSNQYKSVLASKLHNQHASKPGLKKMFPFNPDDLPVCSRCAFLEAHSTCAKRAVSLSRLSTRTAVLDCSLYSRKETPPMT